MKPPMIITPAQEKEVMQLLADGHKANRIAHKIGATEARLAMMLSAMRIKYDCNSSTHLVAYFLRNKLIT